MSNQNHTESTIGLGNEKSLTEKAMSSTLDTPAVSMEITELSDENTNIEIETRQIEISEVDAGSEPENSGFQATLGNVAESKLVISPNSDNMGGESSKLRKSPVEISENTTYEGRTRSQRSTCILETNQPTSSTKTSRFKPTDPEDTSYKCPLCDCAYVHSSSLHHHTQKIHQMMVSEAKELANNQRTFDQSDIADLPIDSEKPSYTGYTPSPENIQDIQLTNSKAAEVLKSEYAEGKTETIPEDRGQNFDQPNEKSNLPVGKKLDLSNQKYTESTSGLGNEKRLSEKITKETETQILDKSALSNFGYHFSEVTIDEANAEFSGRRTRSKLKPVTNSQNGIGKNEIEESKKIAKSPEETVENIPCDSGIQNAESSSSSNVEIIQNSDTEATVSERDAVTTAAGIDVFLLDTFVKKSPKNRSKIRGLNNMTKSDLLAEISMCLNPGEGCKNNAF